MSLLDGDTDVLVFPEVDGDDGYGTPMRVPGTTPVRVRGLMQPVSSDEAIGLGQAVGTVYRLIARDIPGGAWARVEALGREWDVLGEPSARRYTPQISHTSVLLKARRPKAVT